MIPTAAETMITPRIPMIGETGPAFEAHTTQGPIQFLKNFEGK